ncbi:MAG: hypothetical protein P8Y48_11500, partial [Novosphingobium sp.]
VRLDDSIHAARGSMSVAESEGGLPPDSVVEDEEATQRNMLIFGVSLSLALGLQLEPEALQHLPETLRILLGSGALSAAVTLNLLVPGRTDVRR